MNRYNRLNSIGKVAKLVLPLYLFTALPLAATAQTADEDTPASNARTETTNPAEPSEQASALFGYLSYDEALRTMPAYDLAQQKLMSLRTQFNTEMSRVEDEFNAKYEEFLEGRADFPPTILKKRQMELQELMDRNIAFREQSQAELKKTENDLMAPLKQQLNAAIQKVGLSLGLAFILNTDQNACPFINPSLGANVSEQVYNELQQQQQ